MLGSAPEELPELTDPAETQRDPKEPVEDTEHTAGTRLGGDVPISFNGGNIHSFTSDQLRPSEAPDVPIVVMTVAAKMTALGQFQLLKVLLPVIVTP